MTATGLWQDIGAGENPFTKFLRLVFLVLAASVFCFLAMLPLTWPQQAVLGAISIVLALVMARWSDSYLVTLTLVMLSVFCTLRYAYWRIQQVVRYFQHPSGHLAALDLFFVLCLLCAEVYAFAILFLGYFQTIWPLRRAPVPLPDDPEEWPDVDVLIPTYNEPLEVVRYTALGALNMDWPLEKIHVYLLDDGRRPEFEQFASDAGIGYRTRADNLHAKAGNINAALPTITSPFIAVFDSDHVPTRSFLQMTVGWFLRDRKLAVLQTPHHFYSPDPFERNLGQFRVIPNEGELFYGIVQDGNDFWNSSFFCGSCAVLRRSALDAVGGIAMETVTEDAHTSLRMQMKGWNSAYVNIPQAAGLATERLSAHIRQRIRWARGMVQILRTDNPLFAPGLTFAQRLCYFNAMGHFLYAIPRLIFLTAPLIFLLFDRANIPGYWLAILAFALPHLTLSNVTNSRIQGEHRYSFWNEIYETVLAPYILLPTLMALLNPRIGKFNVTNKGGLIKRTYFDSSIAQPFLWMLGFNILGLAFAIPRFFIWDVNRRGAVIMNVLWCCFNVIILGVCTAVARELQQRRTTVRVGVVTPVTVMLAGRKPFSGDTVDISSGGVGIHLSEPTDIALNARVRLTFSVPGAVPNLPATVISLEDSVLRVSFEDLTISQQETLTMALYSRADSWLGLGLARENDKVLRSLFRIFQISMRGLWATVGSIFGANGDGPGNSNPLSIARTSVILLALLTAHSRDSRAQSAQPGTATPAVRAPRSTIAARPTQPAAPPFAASSTARAGSPDSANNPGAAPPAPLPAGQYRDSFTLADAGSPQIEFHNVESSHTIHFTLPQTHVVRAAKVHIFYAFSPSLLPQLSQLKLSINGTLFATIEPPAAQTTPGQPAPAQPSTIRPAPAQPVGPGTSVSTNSGLAEAEFPIPPELLVHQNTLTIEFIGHYAASCEDPASTALWARVLRNTFIETTGELLPLADDLSQLPAPFVDPAVVRSVSVPVVFLAAPSLKAIQAAGIVTSYFGLVSENRSARFPVAIGAIPAGNAVVIAENPSGLPASLNLAFVSGPTVAMRANPSDPYGKILVITGATADDLVIAAQSVALGSGILSGPQVAIEPSSFKLPNPRSSDDAPRWAQTGQTTPLRDYAPSDPDQLQGDGTAPIAAYFRIPPDLYFDAPFTSDNPDAILHLNYRYNSVAIGPASSMQVRVNNAYVGSLPLIPAPDSARAIENNVPIPVVNLRPFSNTITFDFAFQWLRPQHCDDTTPINMQAAILHDSYIDLRGFQHWASLPNLEIFANAGFPFTRFADLSQTTVVLPAAPTPEEIETFLTLTGHFSRQTGFPALRVSVSGPDALKSGAQSDFLVIGSDDDQPAFDKIANNLPVSLRSGQLQVHDTQRFFDRIMNTDWLHTDWLHNNWWRSAPWLSSWFKPQPPAQTPSGSFVVSGSPLNAVPGALPNAQPDALPDALIEGIQSPFDIAGSRSIVVIHLKDSSAFEPFISTFLSVQQSSQIAGSVSVLHGARFQSFRIGAATYHVGALNWFTSLALWFAQVPWLAALIVIAIAFLLAIWTRQWLRSKARTRLTMLDE
jgi:cellulose synthase (UDP-forming)